MGNSYCWIAGYKATEQNGPPNVTENYKDTEINKAYKQARKYVEKDGKCDFCSIGPDSFLKCWKLDKGHKANFRKVSENVLTFYSYDGLKLDDETKTELKKTDFEWQYLYY